MSLRFVILFGVLLALPGLAASPVRYALIVGNNFGKAPAGIELPELKHAELETSRLRERLVALGNFDPSPQRTVALAGKSRAEILQAAKALARQHRADRQALGAVPTLFAFFFTGHGLSGQLLTGSEPLTAADLAAIFNEVGATFTVGVFDACFSGSLDLNAMTSKGLAITPGFNAFEVLPQEVINSEGTMWFVSSRPDQVSYEDDRLGGVFTHFFLEAMERAPRTGFGITLEDIWEYARSQTQRYTSRAARPQTPQKLIRNLTTTGPLYFSFPNQRSAALAFEPDVAGRFLVRYESGQLSELVTKVAGRPLQVPVYPSDLVLEKLEGGGRQELKLQDGDTVWIRASSRWSGGPAIGTRTVTLAAKGSRLEGLVLTRDESAWSGLIDLGYRAGLGPRYGSLPLHGAVAGLRVDRGPWQARLAFTFAQESTRFEAWNYSAQRSGGELSLGWALTAGRLRVGPALSGSLGAAKLSYGSGETRDELVWGGGLALDALWRLWRWPFPVHLHGRLGVLAERSRPAAPFDAPPAWNLGAELSLGLAAEVL